MPDVETSSLQGSLGGAEVRTSAVVMTHPRRLAQARSLAASLGVPSVVLDPAPYDPPSPLRAAAAAWAQVSSEATHHVVLQDDIGATGDLLALFAIGSSRHPASAVAFYANWDSRNGALVRLAALTGAAWVKARPEEYTPTLALCLPALDAMKFATYARSADAPQDDEIMASYLRQAGVSTYLAAPTPVEHLGDQSISGMGHHGIRRSACHLTGTDIAELLRHGETLEHVEFVPYLRSGPAAHVIIDDGAGTAAGPDCLPWREALVRTPLRESDVLGSESPEQPAGTAAGWEAIRTAFGPAYAEELWVHCFLLGWQAQRIAHRLDRSRVFEHSPLHRRIARQAAATIGIAGVERARRAEVSPALAEILSTCSLQRVSQGRRFAMSSAEQQTTEAPDWLAP